MWHLSGIELVVILAVALLVFGKRVPEIARAVGRSIGEFVSAAPRLHVLDPFALPRELRCGLKGEDHA